MRRTFALLIVGFLASATLCGRLTFSAEDSNLGLNASGYIDGATFHIQFEGTLEYFQRSILFVFKPKGQLWCPSFAVIFSQVQQNSPLAYVAAICPDSPHDPKAEPRLTEDLAVDFDREYDVPTQDKIRFKGTVTYKRPIRELTQVDRFEHVYIRGLKRKHGGEGNVFETEGIVKHE